MLKFFRKYNKWILAVGACFLMVTFLIDPSMWDRAGGDGSGEPIGTVDGQTLTVGDYRLAETELAILRQLGLPAMIAREPQLTWLLMKTEARQLGVDAGSYEVDEVFARLGMDETQVATLAQGMSISVAQVRQAVQNWALVQQYRQTMLGLSHQPLQQRLGMYMTAANMISEAGRQPEFLQQLYVQQASMLYAAADGRPRVSAPMLQRLAQDALATAEFTALVVPAGKVLPDVPAPDEAALKAMFDKYKDKLPAAPNEAEGLPFGYRTPDRVKLEYLAVPLDRVRPKIVIDEAEALDYYEKNKDRYRTPPKPDEADMLSARGELRPYTEVRSRVIEELTDQKAYELSDKIIKAARAMLMDQARGLVEKNGYREVPADWQPMPLTSVAEAIQRDPQFGVLPDVQSYGDRWFDGRALSELVGIGRSMTSTARPIPFAAYVLSTREINADTPLASTTRVQTKLPSSPLEGVDGSRYLMRLTAAEKARSPESLDEVREQVTHDARRMAAYELLQKNQQQWLDKALAATDWKVLAESQGLQVVESGPVHRREFSRRGQPQPPAVEGIGRSDAVIDAVFDKATALSNGASIADAPLGQRCGAAGSDATLALVVFRVDQFTPITRSRYEEEVSSPRFTLQLNEALSPTSEDDADPADVDPLSLDAIRKRVGFVSESEKEEK